MAAANHPCAADCRSAAREQRIADLLTAMLDLARPNDLAGLFLGDRHTRGLAPWIEFDAMRVDDALRRGAIFQDDREGVTTKDRRAMCAQQSPRMGGMARVERLFVRTEYENVLPVSLLTEFGSKYDPPRLTLAGSSVKVCLADVYQPYVSRTLR